MLKTDYTPELLSKAEKILEVNPELKKNPKIALFRPETLGRIDGIRALESDLYEWLVQNPHEVPFIRAREAFGILENEQLRSRSGFVDYVQIKSSVVQIVLADLLVYASNPAHRIALKEMASWGNNSGDEQQLMRRFKPKAEFKSLTTETQVGSQEAAKMNGPVTDRKVGK